MKRRKKWLVVVKVYYRDEDGKMCEGIQKHHLIAWDKFDAIKRSKWLEDVDRENKKGNWVTYKIIKREIISVEKQ